MLVQPSSTNSIKRSPRQLAEESLVIASHNAGKVVEFTDLFKPWKITCISAGELALPEPDETGATFLENATLKARAAAAASQLPALADDSGLAISALDGSPGIYSARWAGPKRDFGLAMERVEHALSDSEDRTATFIAALVLAWPDGWIEVFEGHVDGTLVWPPRGTNGFGYDPMFIAESMRETFGELDPDVKHSCSHRAHAFTALVASCLQHIPMKNVDPG
jgi:XTP/dITP diphosphohydrolase